MSEVVVWFADQDGSYVVSVDNATVASGNCLANVNVTTLIPIVDFNAGDNTLVIQVTNTNGTGLANVTIVRIGGPPPPAGLCWAAPLHDDGPREEQDGPPIPNALGRHMRQPLRATDVFILRSGAVVTDWIYPNDPVRVALWGTVHDQKVSQSDADLLIAAGYASNLVACVPAGAGWDTRGWNIGGWNV